MGVVAAIIGAAVSSFGIGGLVAGTTIFGLSAFGSFLVRAAIGIALNALSPKPKAPSLGGSQRSRGYNVNQRGSALDHQIIYGRARVGGAIVFRGTTGTSNDFLHEVVAYTGHEIESFDEIYINDEVVTLDGSGNVTSPSRYNGHVRINTHLGTADQAADADLVAEVAEWTNDHRLRGCAYLYIRYKFNTDVFPNGVPQVTATIKGKKVYDPRSDTTAWSDNPALCLRDYITNGYGLNEAEANVDDDLVSTAADVCDETDTDAGTTRYTCNGNFTTQETPYDLLSDMLTSMGGLLWYAQGKWRMKPAYWTAPSVSFDEDDLRSNIAVKTRHSRRDNFNTVKGTFRGEETDWQVTDYPEVTNQDFIDADNGEESVADIELPFTDNSIEARRIARIALERNRQQLTVSAAFGLRAFQVQVGDVINLSVSRFGWTNKTFEVVAWTFGLTDGMDLQVQMTLREISESVFDEVDDGVVYERDNTTLLSPFFVPAVGLTPSQFLQTINEEVFGVLRASVSVSSPAQVDYVEVQFKKSADTDWSSLGSGEPGRFDIVLAESGDYDIRARARNHLGVKGDWNTISDYYFGPFEAPPAQPQDFSANVIGGTVHLSWSPVPDLDLSHYRILYTPATSGATVSDSVTLIPKLARPGVSASVPAQTGTYFIQAVDKLGIAGDPASLVILVDTSQVQNLNVVETLTEHPTFTGAKDDTATGSFGGNPALVLDTAITFDEAAGNFDDATGLFDGGPGGQVSELGKYQFSNYVDLGEKYTSRVSASLTSNRADYANTFDLATGLFDEREGLFDGDTNFTDTSVKTQVSFTDDDPAGSPVWSAWQDFVAGDIAARAIRFRAVLSSSSSVATPAVTKLTASVDMPDRTEAQSDIAFTGTTTVTFPTAFKATPAIGISLANLTDGQRYAITSKTRTGFTITVYDTGGGVATNEVEMDYTAIGYGREIT